MRNLPSPFSINEESLEGFGTGQVSVSTTPTPLSGYALARKAVKIKATTGPVYVGPAGVTVASGYVLNAGDELELKVYDLSTVYVVAASAQTVSWIAV